MKELFYNHASWISVDKKLPKDNTYVLGHYNGNNWGQDIGQYCVVVRFVRGLSKEERKRGGVAITKMGDESGNNLRPYAWDTHGSLILFGQDVDFWVPLPNNIVSPNSIADIEKAVGRKPVGINVRSGESIARMVDLTTVQIMVSYFNDILNQAKGGELERVNNGEN